jgi:hypothetical protein
MVQPCLHFTSDTAAVSNVPGVQLAAAGIFSIIANIITGPTGLMSVWRRSGHSTNLTTNLFPCSKHLKYVESTFEVSFFWGWCFDKGANLP